MTNQNTLSAREIKFRTWCEVVNDFLDYPTQYHLMVFYYNNKKDTILMQYTGLKDKNGKEIFEGDIVKGFYCPYGEDIDFKPSEVRWNDKLHGWDLHGYFGEGLGAFKGIEVIGNIYQNPELLK